MTGTLKYIKKEDIFWGYPLSSWADYHRQTELFAQVHAPVFIKLAEIRITQVFDKADSLSC